MRNNGDIKEQEKGESGEGGGRRRRVTSKTNFNSLLFVFDQSHVQLVEEKKKHTKKTKIFFKTYLNIV